MEEVKRKYSQLLAVRFKNDSLYLRLFNDANADLIPVKRDGNVIKVEPVKDGDALGTLDPLRDLVVRIYDGNFGQGQYELFLDYLRERFSKIRWHQYETGQVTDFKLDALDAGYDCGVNRNLREYIAEMFDKVDEGIELVIRSEEEFYQEKMMEIRDGLMKIREENILEYARSIPFDRTRLPDEFYEDINSLISELE